MDRPFHDPYLYPNSSTLINKFHLFDQNLLDVAETFAFHKRLAEGLPTGELNYTHLKSIHHHIFQDIYEWAGQIRMINISKGTSLFAHPLQITPSLNKVFERLSQEAYLTQLNLSDFCHRAAHYFSEINAIHAFREGNGRAQRLFLDQIAEQAGYKLAWGKIDRHFYIAASISSFDGDESQLHTVFKQITQRLEQTPQLKLVEKMPA